MREDSCTPNYFFIFSDFSLTENYKTRGEWGRLCLLIFRALRFLLSLERYRKSPGISKLGSGRHPGFVLREESVWQMRWVLGLVERSVIDCNDEKEFVNDIRYLFSRDGGGGIRVEGSGQVRSKKLSFWFGGLVLVYLRSIDCRNVYKMLMILSELSYDVPVIRGVH